MVVESSGNLAEQVLSGTSSRELRLLAARGLLPLPVESLIPLQVAMARDEDPEIAGRAQAALRLVESHLLADFVSHSARRAELLYFGGDADLHHLVLEALLRRRDVPRESLVDMASRLAPEFQEILILRQDAIVEEPRILDGLEKNPRLEAHVRRRILEYRDHLLPRARRVLAELAPAGDEDPSNGEVIEAILEADKAPPHGEIEEVTGLSEMQVRILPLRVRMRLSRGAPRSLRNVLIKDPHPLVAISTLVNNALSDDEIESAARSRLVVEDVLLEISRHRAWMNKYKVLNALVGNPRTPVGLALRYLSRLNGRDLRGLAHNRNVPEAVRRAAQNFYVAKTS